MYIELPHHYSLLSTTILNVIGTNNLNALKNTQMLCLSLCFIFPYYTTSYSFIIINDDCICFSLVINKGSLSPSYYYSVC